MGSLSPFHWIIVLLVIVLLFGAKKIPDLAKGLGQALREFRKATKEEKKTPDAPEKDAGAGKTEKKDTPEV